MIQLHPGLELDSLSLFHKVMIFILQALSGFIMILELLGTLKIDERICPMTWVA